MTVIADFGDWWIETHMVTVSITDAAGAVVSGEITLNRGGNFMSSSVFVQNMDSGNDNHQSIGVIAIERFAAPRQLVQGLAVTSLRLVLSKLAGVSGAANMVFMVTIFLRR